MKSETRTEIAAITVTSACYTYFLIFAQFGFLHQAQHAGMATTSLRIVMGCMAASGFLSALAAGRYFTQRKSPLLLQIGFLLCAIPAFASPWLNAMAPLCFAAAVIGLALGMLTVTTAAALPLFLPRKRLGFGIGIGTGLAYAICNIPSIFGGSGNIQAGVAVIACVAGGIAAAKLQPLPGSESPSPGSRADFPFPAIVLAFLALVWLDSAAFCILQASPQLNRFGWGTASLQWSNAATHLVAALLAGCWLDRRGLRPVLTTAFAALAAAIFCLLSQAGAAVLTHWLYATAVSLYSTALVFAPSAPGPRPATASPAIHAAALFAVAGWFGSVLGIGMAQDLHTIPSWLPIAAAAPIVFLWVHQAPTDYLRKACKPALMLVLAAAAVRPSSQGARSENQNRSEVEYGREVYLSEGCIHCHSQYVRPDSLDAINWGPPLPAGEALNQKPPLIGNRRQGPDLANIGNRRSTAWNELHLINPRSLVPDSRMPSYAYLFESGDSRGRALASYLCSLGADTLEARIRIRNLWCLDPNIHPISRSSAEQLFQDQCAPCHGADGKGNGPLSTKLGGRLPRDLTRAEWLFMSRNEEHGEHLIDLARVIKFGISGSSMPGHETFTDEEMLGVSLYVDSLASPHSAL